MYKHHTRLFVRGTVPVSVRLALLAEEDVMERLGFSENLFRLLDSVLGHFERGGVLGTYIKLKTGEMDSNSACGNGPSLA